MCVGVGGHNFSRIRIDINFRMTFVMGILACPAIVVFIPRFWNRYGMVQHCRVKGQVWCKLDHLDVICCSLVDTAQKIRRTWQEWHGAV